jgi:hypothetical protein
MRVVLIGGGYRRGVTQPGAYGPFGFHSRASCLRLEDLGRRHLWPLMRQFVSNGIE